MQAPRRGPGSRGPGYGGSIIYPPARGVYGYQPSPMEQAVHGVNNFVQSFQQSQQKEKQQAASEFWDSVQKLQAGIPIDMDKAARKARKAGIDLDFEGKNPPPQQQQGGNVLQRAGRAVTGALGMRQPPPVPRDAGVFNVLRQAQQQGQQALALGQQEHKNQMLQAQAKEQQLNLLMKAMGGDKQAVTTMRQIAGKNLTQREELRAMAQVRNPGASETEISRIVNDTLWDIMTNESERRLDSLKMGQQLLDDGVVKTLDDGVRYAGDMIEKGYSDVKPSKESTLHKQVAEKMSEYVTTYKIPPSNRETLRRAAMLEIGGQPERADQILATIKPDPRQASVAERRWGRDMEVIGLVNELLQEAGVDEPASAKGPGKTKYQKALSLLESRRAQYGPFYADMLDWLEGKQKFNLALEFLKVMQGMQGDPDQPLVR